MTDKSPVSSAISPIVNVFSPDPDDDPVEDPAADPAAEVADELVEPVVVFDVDLLELLLQAVVSARHSATLPATASQLRTFISSSPRIL
jgi:hypothetical protein